MCDDININIDKFILILYLKSNTRDYERMSFAFQIICFTVTLKNKSYQFCYKNVIEQ